MVNMSKILSGLAEKQVTNSKKRRIDIDYPQVDLKEKYTIQSTVNYDMFKLLDDNRVIDHVEKILFSFIRIGFLPIPIVVNEFYEIIDGQGRFMACKELNYPIYYVMVKGLRIQHVRKLNAALTPWSTRDTIHSYAADDINYRFFEQLQSQFPGYSLAVIDVAIGKTLTGGGIEKKLNSGKYSVSSREYDNAVRVLSWLEKFSDVFKDRNFISGYKSSLQIAMIFAYRSDCVDTKRMEKQIKGFHKQTNPKIRFDHIENIPDSLKRLQDMYNYNSKKEKIYLTHEWERTVEERKK